MHQKTTSVATTALLLSQNGLSSNLRAPNFVKFGGGACPQTPSIMHVYTADIHVTPNLKNPSYGPEAAHQI